VKPGPRHGDLELLRSLSHISRALALLFLKELDRESLATARGLIEQLLGVDAYREAEHDLDVLAADFAQTFLIGIPPFGSHYLDPSGLLNAETTGEVALLYRQHGFVVDITRAPAEDHLGVELEFVAHLLEREAAAREAGASAAALELYRQREEFLDRHLLPFALMFLTAADETAESTFYRSLCRATREVLIELRKL